MNHLSNRLAEAAEAPVRTPTFTATPVGAAVAELGESPLWVAATAELHWVDAAARRLFTLRPDGDITDVAVTADVTAVELGDDDRLLAVTADGFGRLDPGSGRVALFAPAPLAAGVSMNDCGIDAHGRCWAGSAVRDGSDRGSLFRVAGDGVTTHVSGIGMSNGIDFSPGQDVLYHVDSTAGTITAWRYDLAAGRLGAARVLRTVPTATGLPDGLTVDADGGIWVAVWGAGEVWRLSPDTGETTAVVRVGVPCPTSCAFGGPDLDVLYVTTARHTGAPHEGRLYHARVAARGSAPHRFIGGPA